MIFSDSYWQTILHTSPELTSNSRLTFSESYWLTILKTFPGFVSLLSNTDISRELLANNTTHFSLYQAILTFSEIYYQPILTYSELIPNSIHTFTELLPNNSI